MKAYSSIDEAVKFVKLTNCDWAEFGTAKAESTKVICEHISDNTQLHLFDSFEGLPEDWLTSDNKLFLKKGKFKVDPPDWIFKKLYISVHTGMFEDTIPIFVKEQQKPLSFIHVDCDLYSSTKTIFDNIDKLIVKGTIICFDEFYNYPGWELHEHKAFQEYINKYAREYEFLGQTKTEKAWVMITK